MKGAIEIGVVIIGGEGIHEEDITGEAAEGAGNDVGRAAVAEELGQVVAAEAVEMAHAAAVVVAEAAVVVVVAAAAAEEVGIKIIG